MTQMLIPRTFALHAAQDYALLREEGMAHIRQLCSQLWTDHNTHDPGITTLEALCYAITDLGYRSTFATADLLTGQSGFIAEPELSGFFPAQHALTTTPLTRYDYRKLLLKIEGIRNAWLHPRLQAPGSELPVYSDFLAQQLSLDALNAAGDPNAPLHIKGLYDVWLELEPDPLLGSLNESALPLTLLTAPFKGSTGQLYLEEASQQHREAWADADFEAPGATLQLSLGSTTSSTAEIGVELDGSALPALFLQLDKALTGPVNAADWQNLLENGSERLLARFAAKQARIRSLLEKAACALHDSRNLCEDFAGIATVAAEYIAICVDIEVSPDADLEKVQAAVYFAIEQYLNPPVPFYSLGELLERQLDPAIIFDAPYINHALSHAGQPLFNKPGFVLHEDLVASELRSVVHASDLINVLMDIEDVLNVKTLLLRKYSADGTALGNSERWCLPISYGHQPVLSLARSKILFLKQDVPFLARKAEFEATLRHLRAAAIKQAYSGVEEALTIPTGRVRDTLTHYPVQHDFPDTYQIGEAGLEANASNERRTQARQLKAYLLFFEQILADYLAQLAHLPQLFSLDPNLQQSYFSQNLSYIASSDPALGFAEEFYLDPTLFADAASRNALREDREQFHARRNRLLDHLLARFAEQFTDYVMLMVQQDGDTLKNGAMLLQDKIDFLRQQPVLSREKNRAFNCRPGDLALVWDSDNVSGLEKRAARLAGIDDYSRRKLSCPLFLATLMSTRQIGNVFRVEIKDASQAVLFKSQETFATREAAESAAASIFAGVHQRASYSVDSSGGPGAVRYRLTVAAVTLNHDALFDTANDATRAIEALISRYYAVLEGEVCNSEGFYLIEHLLLRPRTAAALLPAVCIGSESGCSDEDWFSFRASVVLPYWPRRFRNLSFRHFFERLVREQAPAHVQLKICWIDHEQMQQLETALQAWLQALATEPFASPLLTQTQNELLAILQQLRSKYPTATLHDCDDDDSGEPVRLGSTNLGGF
jgi:hypothetical protein